MRGKTEAAFPILAIADRDSVRLDWNSQPLRTGDVEKIARWALSAC